MKNVQFYPAGFTKIEFFRLTDGTEFVTYFSSGELQQFIDEFYGQGNRWSPEAFCDFLNEKYDPTMVIRVLPRNKGH